MATTTKTNTSMLGYRMIDSLDKKFDELDKNGNGSLNMDELFALSDTGKEDAEALWKMVASLRPQTERNVDHFDMSGDAEIEKEEFKHVGMLLLSNQKFRQCDTDDSGLLSKEEFQVAMLELNYEIPQIEVLFARADTDKKGSIDRFEFLSALLHLITDNNAAPF